MAQPTCFFCLALWSFLQDFWWLFQWFALEIWSQDLFLGGNDEDDEGDNSNFEGDALRFPRHSLGRRLSSWNDLHLIEMEKIILVVLSYYRLRIWMALAHRDFVRTNYALCDPNVPQILGLDWIVTWPPELDERNSRFMRRIHISTVWLQIPGQ